MNFSNIFWVTDFLLLKRKLLENSHNQQSKMKLRMPQGHSMSSLIRKAPKKHPEKDVNTD